MLFDTLAEYDTEIAETRLALKNSMASQVIVSGGPGQGQHSQRGDVRAIKEYLELLSKERQVLKARDGGDSCLVQFERPR
jgi:hypothetical protein